MDVIKLFAVEKANNNHFLALPDEQTKNAIDLIICGCVSEEKKPKPSPFVPFKRADRAIA